MDNKFMPHPSVSIGNVGQLAVDLLLSSLGGLGLCRVGALSHPALLPLVGADPLNEKSDNIMTACEVFVHEASSLLLIQLRSSLASHLASEFLSDLLAWIQKEVKASELVTLASSNADERLDEQLTGSQLRFLGGGSASEAAFKDMGRTGSKGWLCLEERTRLPGRLPEDAAKDADGGDRIFLPGAGFAKKLHLMACSAGLTSTVLLHFCNEGDNTREALNLALYFNQWKRVVPDSAATGQPAVKMPVSWRHLFGNAPPPIY